MDGFADLHIHSYYSDGTMSPAGIADEAVKRGVGLIAVCDHNVLEGSRELEALCAQKGLEYISGVEIDSLDGGVDYHILALGADLCDAAFAGFIKSNRRLLDDISVKLVERMSADMPEVSLEDYGRFTYDRRLGGWKGMHYILQKGFADSFSGVRKFYDDYGCPFSVVEFPTVSEVAANIHKAGGYAVLAHPGETIKHAEDELLEAELLRLVSMGIDGVECYCPKNSAEVTKICLAVCREKELLITAGSDCHGEFGKTAIGDARVTMAQLELKDLLKRGALR